MAISDKRIPVYFGNSMEDRVLRDRIAVGAKSFGMNQSAFLRAAAIYALDNVIDFARKKE